ncbi:MAG: DUF493 family protein [Flavobacteriales bacterium]|nr:DUF493 family protein [Flavobacteriales bacterium]
MDQDKLNQLRAKLDEVHQWPAVYMFKFILPNDHQKILHLKGLFNESVEFREQLSRNGNYVSITVKELVLNADTVFERYTHASKIEGIISL